MFDNIIGAIAIMGISAATVGCLICLVRDTIRECLVAKAPSKKHVAAAHTYADRLCGPRAIVALSCGAKVVKLEPHDVDNTSIAEFDAQPEVVREGGFFLQCYARCPYMFDCPRHKALADFHLCEDVRVPLEDGLYLELQRHDGHRSVAVVGEPDVEMEPLPLTGVTFTNGGKRYTTVPPLMQQVEKPEKDVENQVHDDNSTTTDNERQGGK